jgi:tetratricopeptide (TPR) repeat protein
MICRFGGRGEVKGSFEYPVSIEHNSKNEIMVLDRDRNNVQIFSPTVFIENVRDAIVAYNGGNYEKSGLYIEKILKRNATYSLAFVMKGKIYYKQGEWEKSMELFQKAYAYDLYSKAFSEYRNVVYRKYFVFIVLGAAAAIVMLLLIIFKLSRYALKYIYEGYLHGND